MRFMLNVPILLINIKQDFVRNSKKEFIKTRNATYTKADRKKKIS